MLKCAKCGSDVGLPADPRALATSCTKCGSQVDLSSMRTMADAPMPAAPIDADALPAGKMLAGYRLETILGRGGMAVVYKATQMSLSRSVAIKTLPRHLATNPSFVARFSREAGALASLSHPNIITIIDRGSEGDLYYFVMEYIDGTDIQALISGKRPGPAEAVRIVSQVLSALEYAHKRGVIHRDIKPGNVMLTLDGAVKVTDFGIAHLAGSQGTSLGLTMAGAQMGTVNYMAPEQRVDAGRVDARADLYAAGVVLYELLTGQLPLGAFEPASRLNPAVDPRLDTVISRALKPDPNTRYGSAAEMAAALAPLAGAVPQPPPMDPKPAEAPAALAPCPFCKSSNRADARFCLDCGKTLIESCPKCRKAMRAQSKFCDSCGTNVTDWAGKVKAEAETKFEAAGRLEKEGRYAEALTELDAAIAMEGKDLDPLRAKAKERRERVQDAKTKLDEAFRKGQELYDRRDFEKAAAAWAKLPGSAAHIRDAIAEAQKKIELRDRTIREAEAAHAASRWEDALSGWERAATLVPDPPPFRQKLEIARDKAGEVRFVSLARAASTATAARDWAGAMAGWTEALKVKPGDSVATAELRRVESFKRAADRDALVARGTAALAAGKKKDAIESWEQAERLLGPEDVALRAELSGHLNRARTAVAAEKQKMVVISVIGGVAVLFVVLMISALVMAVKGCDDKPGSGGTPAVVSKTASSPDDLFEKNKQFVKSGDWDALWALQSRSNQARSNRQEFEAQMKQAYFPYNPMGINPDYLKAAEKRADSTTCDYYFVYMVNGQPLPSGDPIRMILEDGSWKFTE